MSKWKYGEDIEDSEHLDKMGKMRPRSRTAKSKKSDLKEVFEQKERHWERVDGGFAARVVEVHKRYAFISPEEQMGSIDTRDVWLARVARKFLTADRTERNFISVGDRVYCRPATSREIDSSSDLPQCIIIKMATRTSRIARVDPGFEEREHILAANVDQLLITSSYLSPRVKWGLIDRYLILAEAQQIDAVLIFNKKDLLEEKKSTNEKFYNECKERVEYYRSLGYKVFELQGNDVAKNDPGLIEDLKNVLTGKITLLSGHSGVGKSSIVNLYDPEIVQDVEPDSNIFYKGRHTTSYASFIKVADAGYVIDTPGIRSFVIDTSDSMQLSFGYREIRAFLGQCHFRECRHVDEPKCKIVEKVLSGEIPEWRYNNYLGILLGTTGREGAGRRGEDGDDLSLEDLDEPGE